MFARQKRLQRSTSGLSGSSGMIHKLIQATRQEVSNDLLLCACFKAPPNDWQPLSGDTEVAAGTVPPARCARSGQQEGNLPCACSLWGKLKMCFIARTFSSCCFPAWLFFLCLPIPALSLLFWGWAEEAVCVCQSLQPARMSPRVPALCQGS